MIKVKTIRYNFEGTDFEDCDYEESRKIAVLPKKINIKEEDLDSDAEIEDIKEYLEDLFGFEIDYITVEEE